MAKIIKSKYSLVKRYARFSNTCIYLKTNGHKKVRFGYKVYQKIFKRYRSKKALRINVRKPRISVKRKTSFGKALEIKEKFTYILGGLHSAKIAKYVQRCRTKLYSPLQTLLKILESRLDVLMYRTNVTHNPSFRKEIVKRGYVRVNGKVKKNRSFSIKKNSFMDFMAPCFFFPFAKNFFKEIVQIKLIFKPQVIYNEIDYNLFRAVSHSFPIEKEVFYPFDFKGHYFFRIYPR